MIMFCCCCYFCYFVVVTSIFSRADSFALLIFLTGIACLDVSFSQFLMELANCFLPVVGCLFYWSFHSVQKLLSLIYSGISGLCGYLGCEPAVGNSLPVLSCSLCTLCCLIWV